MMKKYSISFFFLIVFLTIILFSGCNSGGSSITPDQITDDDLVIMIDRHGWKEFFSIFSIDLQPPMHIGPTIESSIIIDLTLKNISDSDITIINCYVIDSVGRQFRSNLVGTAPDYLDSPIKIEPGETIRGKKEFDVEPTQLPIYVECAGVRSTNTIQQP